MAQGDLESSNQDNHHINVQVTGLAGRPHPVLAGVISTQEVVRSRIHVKMLSGDYPCNSYMGSDRNEDAFCRLCQSLAPHLPAPCEDMVHLLTRCRGTADTRTRITPDLLNLIAHYLPGNDILVHPNQTHLTQLILDPTLLNLPMTIRISPDHPALPEILAVCRNLCYAVHKDRTRQLKQLKQQWWQHQTIFMWLDPYMYTLASIVTTIVGCTKPCLYFNIILRIIICLHDSDT